MLKAFTPPPLLYKIKYIRGGLSNAVYTSVMITPDNIQYVLPPSPPSKGLEGRERGRGNLHW